MSDDKKAPEKFPKKMVLPDDTVFTATGVVTRAPPPIKPIGRNWTSPHKPEVPVDWSYWPASRRVTRDEAIALSLGLDPHSLYGSTNGYINSKFCPNKATELLFLKRLSMFSACDRRTNILLSEFAEWAVSVDMTPLPLKLVALAPSRQSTANEEQFCDARELSLNGALIDWEYWSRRTTIAPQQAAELAHCVEPDKGKKDEERSRKIQRLAESLAEHSATWTLSALVKHLGEEAPFNMKQAAASGSIAAAKVGAGDTARDKEDNGDGVGRTETRPDETPPVTAEVVMKAFPTIEWGCSLSKVSETKYQWLNPAVRYKGSPRPRDAKRFSLARVALCLVLGPKKFPRNVAAAIIKKHPEWLPEWESLSDDWLAS